MAPTQPIAPSTSGSKLELKSPDHLDDHPDDSGSRPPTKRARKAINCEPCRSSKLKCDKARPCSSCVLRGTVSQCYADDNDARRDGADPRNELARMRQSLATLEAYLVRGSSQAAIQSSSDSSRKPPIDTVASDRISEQNTTDISPSSPRSVAPGMLGEKNKGGFYAGPTSTATLLLSLKAMADARDEEDNTASDASEETAIDPLRGFDDDLLALLPAVHVIDGLIDFYFEYCNWMYRHVNKISFMAAWSRFKQRASADRLVLATLSVIMAIAVRYLPEYHGLLASLSQSRDEVGQVFYEVAKEAYNRYRVESRVLSLELVELLLIRTHYLTLSKTEGEEIWSLTGELVSIGTAMGLHRDPDKWHMPLEAAERRRWAWWHIITLERWQCFLFGRPLSIGAHHYDTRMPSYVDPKVDPTFRLYLPNLHLFKLAHILGGIVDDAVSIRPVAYDRVLEHDHELEKWLVQLPKELDLDEYRLARALASPVPTDMRLGMQSVLVRTSYYHIRFTLHRPYAAAAHDHATPTTGKASRSVGANTNVDGSSTQHERSAYSLDTAANAAAKLIQLVSQSRPDTTTIPSLSVFSHTHWGPFHCFSAAMFFSFQLITNPDQPGANLFRTNVARVLDILAQHRGSPTADRAVNILNALAPLYDKATLAKKSMKDKEKMRKEVLSLVKSLAFPYHDALEPTRSHNVTKTNGNGEGIVTSSVSLSQPSTTAPLPQNQHRRGQYQSVPPPASTSGMQNSHKRVASTSYEAPTSGARGLAVDAPDSRRMLETSGSLSGALGYNRLVPSHYPPQQQQMSPVKPVIPNTNTMNSFMPMPDTDDTTTWGAAMGFGQGEWARFVEGIHVRGEFER